MPSAVLSFFRPSPLKNSALTDWEFVETGAGAPREVEHAKEQTVADWPTLDMRAFLGDQRQWGAWILENDKLCRAMVATMLVGQARSYCPFPRSSALTSLFCPVPPSHCPLPRSSGQDQTTDALAMDDEEATASEEPQHKRLPFLGGLE